MKSIRLEATTICQLKCPSCPTSSGDVSRYLGSGHLRIEDFKNLVDSNSWISNIELSNWGEIFLNPDLIPIFYHAYKRDVGLSADNGVNLNTVSRDILEAMIVYKFRSMKCSIDGATPGTYSIYRRRGDFNAVIENIQTINYFKKQYNSRYPQLTWQFIMFDHNIHELESAGEMAKKLGMSFFPKLSWENFYVKDSIAKPERAPTREEFKNRFGKHYIRNLCTQLWTKPQINYDGKVLGCCVQYWGDFGNAFKEGLRESLNNEKIEYARQMLLGEEDSRQDIACSSCEVYLEMKESQNWIKMSEVHEI